jgi:hypothetical protein
MAEPRPALGLPHQAKIAMMGPTSSPLETRSTEPAIPDPAPQKAKIPENWTHHAVIPTVTTTPAPRLGPRIDTTNSSTH